MPVFASRHVFVALLAMALSACADPSGPEARDAGAGRNEAADKETDFTNEPRAAPVTAVAAPVPAETAAAIAAPATAAAAPRSAPMASEPVLRERLQALLPPDCRIETIALSADGAKLGGSADSNASISEGMRALHRAHGDGAVLAGGPVVDLALVERREGEKRYRFELNLRSVPLLAP